MAEEENDEFKKSIKKKEKIATVKEIQQMKNEQWEEEHEKKKGRLNFKKIPFIKILITLVIIGCVGAGSYYGYLTYKKSASEKSNYPEIEFIKINLNHDVLKFTFEHLNELYLGLRTLDTEILMIEKEIERIETIEKKYPKQTKITSLEKKNWDKLKSDLLKTLIKLENDTEQLYVSYLVNDVSGIELISKRKDDLMKSMASSLTRSQNETSRLKSEETPTGFLKYYHLIKNKITD